MPDRLRHELSLNSALYQPTTVFPQVDTVLTEGSLRYFGSCDGGSVRLGLRQLRDTRLPIRFYDLPARIGAGMNNLAKSLATRKRFVLSRHGRRSCRPAYAVRNCGELRTLSLA